MAAVIEVFARWSSAEEEGRAAEALRRFCRAPQSSDWLEGMANTYPEATRAWERVRQSLSRLMETTHHFELRVSSASLAQGSTHGETPPTYVSTLSIGYIDGFSAVRWNDPVLVQATEDLARLLAALGATWFQTLTLD